MRALKATLLIALFACQSKPLPEPKKTTPADSPGFADATLCRKACDRVAVIWAQAEAMALEQLAPGIAPSPPTVAGEIALAVQSCTAECVRVTPVPIAECMAAARSPEEMAACTSR